MTSKINIVLVGFMGTGKSAVAKILAAQTGRTLVEMDAEIEKKEGISINEIFAKKGEPYFRQRERETVQELCSRKGLVISTGGGVVLNKDNIRDFKTSGIVICLQADPQTIYQRVRHETHRPLLQGENPLGKIMEILEARRPLYAMADAAVHTDGKTVEEIAGEVMKAVESGR